MKQKLINKLQKEKSSVGAFSILTAILLFLLCSDFDKSNFSTIFHNYCVATREYVGFCTLYCILFCLFLACSKYGKIKLGGKDAVPEYSTFSWVSCLIMAGLGIGIVFYCEEPLFHFNNNPYFGYVTGTAEEVAYSLTVYNWTINAWGQYGVLGVIIAYFYYNKGRELKLSSAFPDSTKSWIKRLVDVVMALGIVAGLTTSLGLGVAQLKGGIDYVFHYDANPYILMGCIGLVAIWSVNSGLRRGVKWLSNLTTSLIMILLLIILVLAASSMALKQGFLEYTGKGLLNFVINFPVYNDFWNSSSDEWAASWSVFYQLWFAAWAAFVAVFVAKISKGRTIREFVLAVVILPTILTAVWYGIFGNIGMAIKDSLYPLMQANLPQSLFYMLHILAGDTGYIALSVMVMITICCIFITSSDSSSYVVATILSKDKEVQPWNKIIWGVIQCLSAMLLFYCGGLSLVQYASVLMGVAVLLIILIGSIYFVYTLIRNEK